MIKPNEVIIIGGGVSLNEGLNKGLKDLIKNKFTIALNHNYKHFNSTITMWIDQSFFKDEWERLKKVPLVIGRWSQRNEQMKKTQQLNNVILLRCAENHNFSDFKQPLQCKNLTGEFVITFCIALQIPTIYLLGFDFGSPPAKNKELENCSKMRCQKALPNVKIELLKSLEGVETPEHYILKTKKGYARAITHWNQDKENHGGIGKINFYYNNTPEEIFGMFKDKRKIYNVSMISRIPEAVFPKINYDQFFKQIESTIDYPQKELREWVKGQLK